MTIAVTFSPFFVFLYLVQQARAELERMGYSYDRRDPRRPRYCKRCSAWKPERAHHCSVTGRCVLRMVR